MVASFWPDPFSFLDYVKQSLELLKHLGGRKPARTQTIERRDWWQNWLASSCPTLLIHGHTSFALSTDHARD
ncbi:MAG TPA: hypothetical protein VIN04_14955, partial [Myxococcota bacterium]